MGNSSYKLFLDDIRQPQQCMLYMKDRVGSKISIYSENWIVVRNYNQFINEIERNGLPDLISFDHDLAQIHYTAIDQRERFEYYEETGEDCAKWLVGYCKTRNVELPEWIIHSMNPVGAENIKNVLKVECTLSNG